MDKINPIRVAVVLLVCVDKSGLFRFPIINGMTETPGFRVELDLYFDKLQSQIAHCSANILGNSNLARQLVAVMQCHLMLLRVSE